MEYIDNSPAVTILPLSVGIEVLRYLFRFRLLLGLATGCAYILTLRGSPGYSWTSAITSLSIVLSIVPAVRPRHNSAMPGQKYLLWQVTLCLLLVVAEALADRRVVIVAVLFPLDGYMIGTLALVSYIEMFRGSQRAGYVLFGLGSVVELARAFGHHLGTNVPLFILERCGPWLLTVILMRYLAATLTRLCEDEGVLAGEREISKRAIHLHNHALQVLVMAEGWARDWTVLRSWAALEATRLATLARGIEAPAIGNLAAALVDAVEEQRSTRLLDVRLQLAELTTRPFPTEIVSAFVESTHEALNNVAKHVPGATAVVSARGGLESITVTISNTASGTIGSSTVAGGGYGLRSAIGESMGAIGGRVSVVSSSEVGTEVSLSWVAPPIAHSGERVSYANVPAGTLMPYGALWRLIASLLVLRLMATSICVAVTWETSPARTQVMYVFGTMVALWVVTVFLLALARSWNADTWRYIPYLCVADLSVAVLIWLLSAVIMPHGTLLSFFQDSFSQYGSMSAAIYPFLAGRRTGRMAWLVLAIVTLTAPLINGYPLTLFVASKVGERLLYTTIAFYIASRIAELSVKGVQVERAIQAERARGAYLAQVTGRLLAPLEAIATDPNGSLDVRTQAKRASAWGYRLLSSQGRISDFEESLESLVDSFGAELRGRLTKAPGIVAGHALSEAIEVALQACLANTAIVTISEVGATARVALVHAAGPGAPSRAIETMQDIVAAVGGRVEAPMTFQEGGARVVVCVPAGR